MIIKNFHEVIIDRTSGNRKFKTSEYFIKGNLPIIDQGKEFIVGFTDNSGASAKVKLPCIVFGDHTKIFKFVDFPFALGADGTKVLETKESADTKYDYYYLSQINLPGKEGYNRNFKYLKEIKIPLPSLQTQKQIAQLLEAADRARQQRKAANALTEQFLKSSFLHLFGDPVLNTKSWVKCTLKSLATKYSDGPFGSNLKTEHYTSAGMLVIRLENIGVNQFKDSSKTFIPIDHYRKLEKHSCFPGDVIIGTMGEPNLRACIIPDQFTVAINKADCVLFRPNKNVILSEYVSYMLNFPSFVKSISNLVLGQTRGRISMRRLSSVEIPVPPLPLQQQFASLVAGAEQLRQKQKQSEKELEHLFQALLQQYFGKGAATVVPTEEEPLNLAAEASAAYTKEE